jgi:hypothetical protein
VLNDVLPFIEFFLSLHLLSLYFSSCCLLSSRWCRRALLRIILTALAHRVGLSAGLMMLNPFVTALAAAGEVWDRISIIGLIYLWYTFFKQLPAMGAAWSNSRHARPIGRPRPRAGAVRCHL